ncbi:cytochrome P450, partial [Roridomyces roridus]
IYLLQRRPIKLPLPPGPPKLPVLGNLLDHPSTLEWETYMEWSKSYNSDILHLSMAGKSVVILSSMNAAVDLLQKRSAIYSDRVRLPMVNELMRWEFNFGSSPFASPQAPQLPVFDQLSNSTRPKQLSATHRLLRRSLQRPDRLLEDLRNMVGEIIIGSAYGLDVLPEDDPYVKLAEQANAGLIQGFIPGRFLVDSLPILKYVPRWFPGSGPYTTALMKEAIRWKPTAPVWIPHFVGVEDEYRGYRIPAGSVVIPNIWAILHDEALYPEPYAFRPERFLINGKLDPSAPTSDVAFGYGRRFCPGQDLSLSILWITMASILATFDITKAVGEDGKVIEPSCDYSSAFVLVPLPFEYSIKPRSKESEALIRSTVDQE